MLLLIFSYLDTQDLFRSLTLSKNLSAVVINGPLFEDIVLKRFRRATQLLSCILQTPDKGSTIKRLALEDLVDEPFQDIHKLSPTHIIHMTPSILHLHGLPLITGYSDTALQVLARLSLRSMSFYPVFFLDRYIPSVDTVLRLLVDLPCLHHLSLEDTSGRPTRPFPQIMCPLTILRCRGMHIEDDDLLGLVLMSGVPMLGLEVTDCPSVTRAGCKAALRIHSASLTDVTFGERSGEWDSGTWCQASVCLSSGLHLAARRTHLEVAL